MDAEDLVNLWPDGAVQFRLVRYPDGMWCADLHTYGVPRSATTVARTAGQAIAELQAKVKPTAAPAKTTDYDDLI